MTGLARRLTALEEIAEQCRRREQLAVLKAEIIRQYAEAGIPLSPDQLDQKAARALAMSGTMALLAASGLTLDQIAQHLAIEHDLDPERVLAAFHTVRARWGR